MIGTHIFAKLAEESSVERWTFHIINDFNYNRTMLMKSLRNGFGNERHFVYHSKRSLNCWIFLIYPGKPIQSLHQSWLEHHQCKPQQAYSNSIRFLLKKWINTWRTSAAFDVVSKGWQKRSSSLFLSSATYLIYASGC